MNTENEKTETATDANALLCAGHYYRFIFKNEKGELCYTVVKTDKRDNELAIATFENSRPNLVWRRFEEIFEDLPCT